MQHLVRTADLLEPARHLHGGVHVSTSEVFALSELIEAGTLSQHELGAHLGLEKSTVSRLAAAMEQRGWLLRERDPGDRRLYRLTLTDAGQDVAHRVGEDLRAHHALLLDQLTPEERQGLTVGLAGLVRELQAHHRSHHS
jgi:DNA-binding MarR family transcriptional regulator